MSLSYFSIKLQMSNTFLGCCNLWTLKKKYHGALPWCNRVQFIRIFKLKTWNFTLNSFLFPKCIFVSIILYQLKLCLINLDSCIIGAFKLLNPNPNNVYTLECLLYTKISELEKKSVTFD